MKRLAFVLAIIIAVSAVSNIDSQPSFFTPEFAQELKDSNLGRTILSFAQLASMASSFDFNKLFDAIDELYESMKEAKQEENVSFQQDYEQYVSDVQFYTNQVTQYTAEVAEHETDLRNLGFMLEIYQETLQVKRADLEKTQGLKQELEGIMERNYVIYQAQLKDFNQVIEVLDQALELVRQVKDDSSFLQLKHEDVYQVGKKMEEVMQDFQHRRVFYEPFVEAFLQMASEKFADQEMVTKVIRLLQDLRGSLDAGRTTLSNQYETERQANQQILDQYNNKIQILTEVVIPMLVEDIATTQEEIKTKQGLLQDAQNNLAEAQENLDATEKRWVAREALHRALLDQYAKELNVLDQAVTALEKGGIRRS